MRSVRLIVLEKLSRMPDRTISMPIRSATLSAMDAMVSDVASNRMRATRDGDQYVLNGSKRFITHGSVANLLTVFALTDPADTQDRTASRALLKRIDDLRDRGFLVYREFSDEYRIWQGSDVDLGAQQLRDRDEQPVADAMAEAQDAWRRVIAKAVELGIRKLIAPELGHIAGLLLP